MNPRFLFLALALASVALSALAAEKPESESSEKKQASEAEIKARLAEHAARKKAAAEEVAKAGEKENRPSDTGAPVLADQDKESAASAANAPAASAGEPAAAKPDADPATVLPEVRIRKDRITELDEQLAKQNKEIAREKQKTKPTALDETINSPKLSKAFALFGGQSSEDRSSIARERVAMMEEEKEIMEAISQAETKEEKEQLQKVLDAMRTMRRELEQSLR